MSAFMVNEPTMQKTICGIQRVTKEWSHLRSQFDIHDWYECQLWDYLGVRLFALNRYVVVDRYPDGHNFWPVESHETSFVACNAFAGYTDVECLKAMKCLRYQCAEGDTDTKPLYLALENAINAMMSKIIDAMPAYNDAQWGR